jgi:hypothetical protein
MQDNNYIMLNIGRIKSVRNLLQIEPISSRCAASEAGLLQSQC